MISQPRDDRPTGTLAVSTTYSPRKRRDVLELDMGDGVVLYDAESRLIHHLNPSASVVWHLADGSANLGQLSGEIADELGLDSSETHEQLTGLVAELDALGLVEDAHR